MTLTLTRDWCTREKCLFSLGYFVTFPFRENRIREKPNCESPVTDSLQSPFSLSEDSMAQASNIVRCNRCRSCIRDEINRRTGHDFVAERLLHRIGPPILLFLRRIQWVRMLVSRPTPETSTAQRRCHEPESDHDRTRNEKLESCVCEPDPQQSCSNLGRSHFGRFRATGGIQQCRALPCAN